MAEYAVERGIEYSNSSFLISITGITTVISRPLVGLCVTLNWLDSVIICNYSMILAGMITVILPFLTEYWMMCLYAALLGSCIGEWCFFPKTQNKYHSSWNDITVVHLINMTSRTNFLTKLFQLPRCIKFGLFNRPIVTVTTGCFRPKLRCHARLFLDRTFRKTP